MSLDAQTHAVLKRFQDEVAGWRSARWQHLLFGVVAILSGCLGLYLAYWAAGMIDDLGLRLGGDTSDESARAVMSLAVAFAAKTTAATLSLGFGVQQLVLVARTWHGNAAHIALAAVIEREFGIVGSGNNEIRKQAQPTRSRRQLSLRSIAAAIVGVGAAMLAIGLEPRLDGWQSLGLLLVAVAACGYYLWARYETSYYGSNGDTASPSSSDIHE